MKINIKKVRCSQDFENLFGMQSKRQVCLFVFFFISIISFKISQKRYEITFIYFVL